jgi:hypothetical protein
MPFPPRCAMAARHRGPRTGKAGARWPSGSWQAMALGRREGCGAVAVGLSNRACRITAPGAFASGGRGPAGRSPPALLCLARCLRQAQLGRGAALPFFSAGLQPCAGQPRKKKDGRCKGSAGISCLALSPAGAGDWQAGLCWPSLLWQ